MIDPNDAACSPSACLRAEANDLREKAALRTENVEEIRAQADELAQEAEAMTVLAARYDKAAQALDDAEGL